MNVNFAGMQPGDLPPTVRAILGLSEMGLTSAERIAYHVFQTRDGEPINPKLIEYVEVITHSQDPVIQAVFEFGLPLGSSTFIHRPIRCEQCGSMVRLVPCVLCYMMDKSIGNKDDESDDQAYRALEPKFPTQYLPGSVKKQGLMRRRVARGESPFHPDDAPSHPGQAEPVTIPYIRLADIIAASIDRRAQ